MNYTELKIKQMEKELAELREEKANSEIYKTIKTGADEAYIAMKAFMDAGFSETQAFQMLKLVLEQNMKR